MWRTLPQLRLNLFSDAIFCFSVWKTLSPKTQSVPGPHRAVTVGDGGHHITAVTTDDKKTATTDIGRTPPKRSIMVSRQSDGGPNVTGVHIFHSSCPRKKLHFVLYTVKLQVICKTNLSALGSSISGTSVTLWHNTHSLIIIIIIIMEMFIHHEGRYTKCNAR